MTNTQKRLAQAWQIITELEDSTLNFNEYSIYDEVTQKEVRKILRECERVIRKAHTDLSKLAKGEK